MKLYTSFSLNKLAEKLIEEILDSWKNPFFAPVVIFADKNLEQWFKLLWVKKNRSSVLMNLNVRPLENFIWENLAKSKTPEERMDMNILSAEIFRNFIIKYLSEKEDGKFKYEELEDEEVTKYLKDKNDQDKINQIHLFDFATVMAGIFLNYESSRDKSFLSKLNGWQKKLYDDVKNICNENKYFTIFDLYNEENQNKYQKEVFLFGFSGIGQQYRKILKNILEDDKLHVFVQTTDDSKENGNQLFKWSDYGKENLKLWDKEDEFIDSESSADENSILQKLQDNLILNRSNKDSSINELRDESFSVTAVCSKRREIEVLHSRICELLKSGRASSTSEILVCAQNINDYKVAVHQIFDAVKKDKNGKASFPQIKYKLLAENSESSNVVEALNILAGIWEKNYFSRSDFFELARNSFIQYCNNISDEEVWNWNSWIDNLHVYRDRNDGDWEIHDWKIAKNRLLLAKITANCFEIDDERISPYADMESQNLDSLYRFINLIDVLEDWKDFSSKDEIEPADIEKIKTLLEVLFLDKDKKTQLSEEFNDEKSIFKNVEREMDFHAKDGNKILKKCFMLSVLATAENSDILTGKIFTEGVSFTNLKANGVIPAKYVFVLGMDSKSFPGIDVQNVLDLREKEKGDDSIPAKNRNAFFQQLMNAEKGFYISYVSKDLQKDEEYYRADVINEIFKSFCTYVDDAKEFRKFIERSEVFVGIDEKRDWNQLFTARQFRNKKNGQALSNFSEDSDKENDDISAAEADENLNIKMPEKVSISQLKKFLVEPFQFMVERRFCCEDDESENERIEFEPLKLGNIENAELIKEYVMNELSGGEHEISFESKLQDKNIRLPGFFHDKAIEEILSKGMTIFDGLYSKVENPENLVIDGRANLKVNEKWTLTGKVSIYEAREKSYKFFELVTGNSIHEYHYLNPYLSSLAMIADSSVAKDEDDEFSVELYAVSQNGIESKEFTVTKAKTIELLNKIYEAAFDENEKNPKFMPIDDVVSGNVRKSLNDIADDRGPWEYFQKAKLFDFDTDLGYSDDDFENQYKAKMKEMRKFFAYMPDNTAETENDGE